MKHHIVLLMAMSLSTGVMAATACDSPNNDFDGLYCLNKVYQEADKDLNSHYKSLVAQLDSQGRAKLKSSQLDWMRQRNDNCSRHEDGSFFVNLRCATDTTIARVQFLQDRERECKATGCQNSKL